MGVKGAKGSVRGAVGDPGEPGEKGLSGEKVFIVICWSNYKWHFKLLL